MYVDKSAQLQPIMQAGGLLGFEGVVKIAQLHPVMEANGL